MRVPAHVRGVLLTTLIMMSGAARAAYPTPGAEGLDFQVHPVPMANVQEIMDEFLAGHPENEYSVVADARTGSIVAVAPPEIQRQLASLIQHRTEERMRRFVVEMQISRDTPKGPELLGAPRLEVPYGERRSLNFDGKAEFGGPSWRTRLEVEPTMAGDGRIKLRLRGGEGEPREVEVSVAPGEDLVIDAREAVDPRVRELARELNTGGDQGAYSLTLSVHPL